MQHTLMTDPQARVSDPPMQISCAEIITLDCANDGAMARRELRKWLCTSTEGKNVKTAVARLLAGE